jgi:hypothetical protein
VVFRELVVCSPKVGFQTIQFREDWSSTTLQFFALPIEIFDLGCELVDIILRSQMSALVQHSPPLPIAFLRALTDLRQLLLHSLRFSLESLDSVEQAAKL